MSIVEVKDMIKNLYGREVKCVINRGRNKLVKVHVKIDQV